MRTFSWRPSPALLVAVLAVSIALVGTAAAGPIDTPIAQDSRLTKKDRRIAAKIARQLSLRFIKRFTPILANRQITQRAPNLSVGNAENASEAASVADGAITTDKLSDDAVTSAKIDDGAVGTDQLSPGAVGVALAAVNVDGSDGTVRSYFNRLGGEPTVNHPAVGRYVITIPGLPPLTAAGDLIHMATPSRINGDASASVFRSGGNPAVQIRDLTNADADRNFVYVFYGDFGN